MSQELLGKYQNTHKNEIFEACFLQILDNKEIDVGYLTPNFDALSDVDKINITDISKWLIEQYVDGDRLGDIYEFLLSGNNKLLKELYTPQQVSKILSKLVSHGKDKIKSAYDPTCGSGSLLLRIGAETEVDDFYGQEINLLTRNLCRMNLVIQGCKRFDVEHGDTLEHPAHIDKEFEAIVANPPFSAKWRGKNHALFNSDDRFSQYGALAPTSKADFAFVQHILHHLADNGRAAVVLPHGVLFRGAAEGKIRKYIIEEQDSLDAVIGLAPNLFYGTSIPTCILVFKKCRENDDIFFIDASKQFEKQGTQNVLTDAHVATIMETYLNRTFIDKMAYSASLDEIRENDYNLNIPRYVDTFEPEEPIDLDEIVKKIKEVDEKMVDIDAEINAFCAELGITSPVGGTS